MSLQQSVINGDKPGITYAISPGWIYDGEDINSKIFDSSPPTALGWALENKQYDTAKFLIKSGAKLPSLEHKELYKTTLYAGQAELIEIFLDKFGYEELANALEIELFAWAESYDEATLKKLLNEKYADYKPIPEQIIIDEIPTIPPVILAVENADNNPHDHLVEQLLDLGLF